MNPARRLPDAMYRPPFGETLPKSELRHAMRARRRRQDLRITRHHSDHIRISVRDLPEMQQSQTIALYSALPDEVDTQGIARDLVAAGKRVLYPCVAGDALLLRCVSNVDDLTVQGAFGIREPDSQRCPLVDPREVDAFLAPGVAFDLTGARVGFGGGFYDRLLRQAREDAWIAGLAFEFQVVHAIVTEPHDQLMNCVITHEAVYQPYVSRWTSGSEEETRALAHRFVAGGLERGGVLALHGGLGVGKTVFVSGLAQALQCREETASPTFVYCREYHGVIPLLHVDAYRLDGVSEVDAPFWDELLESEGLAAVEWAERLGDRLPKRAAHLQGDIDEQDRRRWTLWTPLREQLPLHGGEL